MKRRALTALVLALQVLSVATVASLPTSVSAQDPRTTGARTARVRRARRPPPPPPAPMLVLRVETGDPRPFHVRVRLDAGAEPLTDALVDLRVLGFEITRSGAPARARPLRCAWPSVPARNDAEKLVAAPPPGSVLVDDVVDLRMYCVGAAYEALVRGGSVRPVYGHARASRDRYVARASRRGARPLAQVAGASFTLEAPATQADAPLRVAMATADVTRGGAIVVRPYVEGTARAARAYVRDDLWSFDVRTPAGRTARCVVPRHPVVPIFDFFTRFAAGRRSAFTIDLGRLCPAIVDEPGIYDVVPTIELVYDGANVDVDALTGRFRGEPSFLRVRPPADALPSEIVRPEVPAGDAPTATAPAR